LAVQAERGYIIPAIDTETVDYLSCAVQLAKSIRQWHPDADISVLTVKRCSDPVFNHVIPLPYGDLEGYTNDWQVFYASPYRQTIKLEADMLVTSPIDHWWSMLEHRDVVISTGSRNFYNQPNQSRFYRKVFDANQLSDVYNAITYWRLSSTAKEFWQLVRSIFTNWSHYCKIIKFAPDTPDTDLVYAMAARIMGDDQVTMPFALYPQIVHMKTHLLPIQGKDWTQELLWEYVHGQLRINTIAQWGCVHYHNKTWCPEHEQ